MKGCVIGVSTVAGAIAFTVMPVDASSTASTRTRCDNAIFEAAYAPLEALGRIAAAEDKAVILLRRSGPHSKWGTAARAAGRAGPV